MGDFVGHKTREWYDSVPPCWRLMLYNESRKDGKSINMEALVDEHGNYSRLLAQIDDVKRVLLVVNGTVYGDSIYVEKDGDEMAFDSYVALDESIYSSKRVPFYSYLGKEHTFMSADKNYDGEIPANELFVNFADMNEKLIAMIQEKGRTM